MLYLGVRMNNYLLCTALGCTLFGCGIAQADITTGVSVEGLTALSGTKFDGVEMPDTFGARLTGSVYIPATEKLTHEFNLSIAPQWGSKTTNLNGYLYGYYVQGGEKIDLFAMPLTAGYRLHFHVTEHSSVHIGARAGYSFVDAEDSFAGSVDGYYGTAGADSGIDGGFTYAAGLGFSHEYAEGQYFTLSYEYQNTKLNSDDMSGGQHARQHVISAGVGFRF